MREALEAPSLYDEFLRLLARAGYAVPAAVLERDVTQAWTFTPDLVPIFAAIYADPPAHWAAYETCEELVDLEDNFQLWRFRHLKTVERIIGFKKRHRRLERRAVPAEARSSSPSSPSCSPCAPRSGRRPMPRENPPAADAASVSDHQLRQLLGPDAALCRRALTGEAGVCAAAADRPPRAPAPDR